jgi:hypothetical protein
MKLGGREPLAVCGGAGLVVFELTAPSRSSAPSLSAVDMRQDMLVS